MRGKIIIGKDIVDSLTEYIGELYEEKRPYITPDTENCDWPPVL